MISHLRNCILHILSWDPPTTDHLSPSVSILKRITPSFTILLNNTTLISRSVISLCFVMWLTLPWPFPSEIHYFSPEENYNQNQHDQLQSLPTKDFTSSAATPHYGGTPRIWWCSSHWHMHMRCNHKIWTYNPNWSCCVVQSGIEYFACISAWFLVWIQLWKGHALL